jgi:hypothetical protein
LIDGSADEFPGIGTTDKKIRKQKQKQNANFGFFDRWRFVFSPPEVGWGSGDERQPFFDMCCRTCQILSYIAGGSLSEAFIGKAFECIRNKWSGSIFSGMPLLAYNFEKQSSTLETSCRVLYIGHLHTKEGSSFSAHRYGTCWLITCSDTCCCERYVCLYARTYTNLFQHLAIYYAKFGQG